MITKISGNVPEHEYYLNDDLIGEVILENTEEIGQYAFHFTAIDKINLENVKFIGGAAFEFTKIKNANLKNIHQLMSDVFATCIELSDVTIGNHLFSIGYRCFAGCESLKELKLPDSVHIISRDAFRNSGLISFTVPPLIKILEEGIFCNCKYLENINLGNVETISSIAIANTALLELELPNTIKRLEVSAIYKNKKLTKITIPTTIEEIEKDAINTNLSLEEIVFKGNKSYLSKIKGFKEFYEEYSDIIKIEPLSLDDILKNMHNHKKCEIKEIENER